MDDFSDIGIEVRLEDPDAFLKIRETLKRIGIASYRDEKPRLIQTCHILHKQGRYFIVHFKSLFKLDSRNSYISDEDIGRRNAIAFLLDQWGLCKIIDRSTIEIRSPVSSLKIVPYQERHNWVFEAKYQLGSH